MSRLLPIFIFFAASLSAQSPQDAVVPLQLSAGLNPPAVFLNWQNPQPSDIILRRRVKGAEGDTWVELLNANSSMQNGYFDTGLDGNEVYEYALERKTGNITAYGYAFANFFTPVVDQRGKILVFIDSTTADQLGADLVTFKNDLRGEGWQTMPFKTGPSTSVQWVKNKILEIYNADPAHVKAILLIGNVPIPYAGSLARDNKPDHIGAWPCDAYYGDVNGLWTDNSVNIPNTARLANRNVPGDGKFDQDILPSSVEIPVGRLDFRRLSAATFGAPPVELLRKYLWKNHLWRTGQYKVPNLALVDDELGWSGGEAFASDGYRNAIPLVGEGNVIAGAFLNSQRYLLGYGAGTNGTYSGAGGIGTAADFASDSVRTVFASLYGDYLGDWDFETNPLLPALLASKGGVLAVSWAGRPHWMQQGLATGETIGYALKETQNAQYNTAYGHSNAESGTHIALLGDPTLRAKIVAPATNLTVTSNCNKVNLHWTASPDPEVLAYLIYRSFSLDGPYLRVTPDLVFQTSWEDLSPPADTLFYSVRAVKLDASPGTGAFYNSSTGAPGSVVFVPGSGPTAIALGGQLNCNVPSLTLGTNFNPPNSVYQWYNPNGTLHNGFIATEPGIYTVVVTAPNGCTTAAYATVYLDTLLPDPGIPPVFLLDCNTPTASFTVPAASPGVHYFFNGVEVLPGQALSVQNSSVFTVSSTDNGCSKSYIMMVQSDFVPPAAQINYNGLVLDCLHPSVQLSAVSNTPDVTYAWSVDGGAVFSFQQVIEAATAGTYCLTVTGTNGCTATSCVVVVVESAMALSVSFSYEVPCFNRILLANVTGGNLPYEFTWSTGQSGQSVDLWNGFSGNISVTVTDGTGCMTTNTLYVNPVMDIFAVADEESTPGAADGYIDLWVFGGQAPITYLWSNGSTSEDLFGVPDGTYSVLVTDANGCNSGLAIQLLSVGTQDLFSELSFRILPNPATAELGVYFIPKPTQTVHVRLTDLSGRLISAQPLLDASCFFDVSALPAGLYVLWIETDTGRVANKVVVGK